MAASLEVPAHHAEGHHGVFALPHHAGDDRVHRPLAAGDAVGVVRVDDEARAPVLQHHAGRRAEARAEGCEQRVDEGDRVALAIHHGEVDGIAVGRVAGRQLRRHGARGVDVAAHGVGVAGREQPLHRHVHRVGVGDQGRTVAIAEARGFRLQVQALCAHRVEPGEVEALKDVEDEQRDDSLPVGRALVDVEAPVVRADGLHRLRL